MKRICGTLVALLLGGPGALSVLAHQGDAIPVVTAVRTDEAPVIDGVLDEEVWNLADPVSGFVQQQPDTGQPSAERTVVRLLYDHHALYVAAWLYDSGPVTTLLARRDSFLPADWFAIYLDPHHDHRTAAMFRVNPVGVVRDSWVVEEEEDRDWDAVWSAAATLADDGWRAEMRIPWSQLRFPSRPEHVWGINFHREIARNNEYSRLVATPRNEQGFVSRFAHLRGIRGIEPPRRFEALPYAVARTEQLGTADPDDPFNGDGDFSADAGLDLKYGLTSNLTLTATINPDFGQVEVDPAQINLTAFELFFPERRPFFIEGGKLFAFDAGDANLFYSRRIGRAPQIPPPDADWTDLPEQTTILGAVKLTGRTASGWTIAALDALTSEEDARVRIGGEERREVVEPMTNSLVTRIAKDFGESARLGGILTSVERDTGDSTSLLRESSLTAGLDGYRWFGDRDYLVDGSIFGSRIDGTTDAIALTQHSPVHYFQRPDADHVAVDSSRTSLDGWGARLFAGRMTGNLRYSVFANTVSPGFEPNDLGFLSTADRLWVIESVSWVDPEPGRTLREWFVTLSHENTWNHDGDRLDDDVQFEVAATLLNYWSGRLFAEIESAALDDRETRGGPLIGEPAAWSAGAAWESDRRRPLFVELKYERGGDDLGSREESFSAEISLRPASNIDIAFAPEYGVVQDTVQYVETVIDPAAAVTYGARYVFAEIDRKTLNLSTRVDWSFTPNLSLQLFLQPFVASGDYSRFKELTAPATSDYAVYGAERGSIGFDDASNRYTVDPGDSGAIFSFRNPDFNVRSLLANAVLRWEFRPGSTVYFAWTENREDRVPSGLFDVSRDLSALSDLPSDDVFLIKVSYWLGL